MELELEIRNLDKVKNLLSGIHEGAERATTTAINRSLISIKKEMKKKVTHEYDIKSTDVEKTLAVKKATFSMLSGTIISKSPRIALYKFLKGTSGNDIKVRIKKSEGTKIVKRNPKNLGNPFLANMKNGHRGIFQRKNKSSYPIKENYSLSIPQMLGYKSIGEYVMEKGNTLLEKAIEREVERILRGYV